MPTLSAHIHTQANLDPSPGLVDRLRQRLGLGPNATLTQALAPVPDPAPDPTPDPTTAALAALTTEREQLAATLTLTTDQLENTRATLATLQSTYTQVPRSPCFVYQLALARYADLQTLPATINRGSGANCAASSAEMI